MLFLMGCWGDDCQEPPEDRALENAFKWMCQVWSVPEVSVWNPAGSGRGGCKSTETHSAASACWISPAFLRFSCSHTPGWKMAFFTPRRVAHQQSKLGPGSASDPYGFRQVELLLSTSQSLCLFSPSHLFIGKPLRWDITSGVWKRSAQMASDFYQGFWGSVL